MRQLPCALAGIVLAAVASRIPAPVAQEHFPARPVQVIVPATPGGPVDTAVRMIEPALSSALGAPVVLVNRPGSASGTLGHARRSRPLLPTATPSGRGSIRSSRLPAYLRYTRTDSRIDDFTLLGNYATDVSVLAVSADAPWKNCWDDLIAYARANPGKLNYASAGVGTVSALSMQALAHQFNLEHGRGTVSGRRATDDRRSSAGRSTSAWFLTQPVRARSGRRNFAR